MHSGRRAARNISKPYPGAPSAARRVEPQVGVIPVVDQYIYKIRRVQGSPQILLVTTPADTEGTDFPFRTRGVYFGARARQRLHFKHNRAQLHARRRRRSEVSHLVLDAIDSSEPSTIARAFVRNRATWLAPRLWQRRLSRLRRYLQGATLISRLPAATYATSSCDLLSEVQRHLLENTIDEGVTWSLWSSAEVLSSLNERLNSFVSETGIIRKRDSITGVSGTAAYSLPSDLLRVCRVTWDNVALTRTDPMAAEHGYVGVEAASGTPFAYVEQPQVSLRINLVPTPDASGTIDVEYVPEQTAITATCSVLPVPRMFVPYIKWGVLADLLSKEGEANDPERAKYAEQRYEEGVKLAKLMSGVAS